MRKILFMCFLLVVCANAILAQATYKGKVTDKKNGQPLSGATVTLKGTTNAVATDANGEFTLIAETGGTHTLVASYIGYAELALTAAGEYLRFELSESTGLGDEVVVTASRRPQKNY
jgi:hypothetical protein